MALYPELALAGGTYDVDNGQVWLLQSWVTTVVHVLLVPFAIVLVFVWYSGALHLFENT